MLISIKYIFNFSIILILITACNPTSKQQNLKGFYGYTFCLDVAETEKVNRIKIGNGKMIFNKDMTFFVTNDSLKYSNIHGTWDLCCLYSDYGNYVFKVDGNKAFKTSTPNFFIFVTGKKIELIFSICK